MSMFTEDNDEVKVPSPEEIKALKAKSKHWRMLETGQLKWTEQPTSFKLEILDRIIAETER